MVRRYEGGTASIEVEVLEFQSLIKIDVIQMKDRKDTWIGSRTLQVITNVRMLEMSLQRARNNAAHPFIEIAQHNARTLDFTMVDDLFFEQATGLLPMFKQRRPEMDVE